MKGVEIPTDLARKQPRGCGRAIGLHGSPRRGDHHVRYSRPLDRLPADLRKRWLGMLTIANRCYPSVRGIKFHLRDERANPDAREYAGPAAAVVKHGARGLTTRAANPARRPSG